MDEGKGSLRQKTKNRLATCPRCVSRGVSRAEVPFWRRKTISAWRWSRASISASWTVRMRGLERVRATGKAEAEEETGDADIFCGEDRVGTESEE
jgi:hypothetical protein